MNPSQQIDMMYGVLYSLAVENGGAVEIPMLVPARETLNFLVNENRRTITVSVVPDKESVN